MSTLKQANGISYAPNSSHILRDRLFNKDTAFTVEERDRLGLRGLLPPVVETIEKQAERAYAQFQEMTTPLQKYIYLNSLAIRNETLFYRLVIAHLAEMVPVVYTPTVGEGCTKFSAQFRESSGLYLTRRDKGCIRRVLDNWARPVDLIVVTDGGRILGLGDLGSNGMGIPIGKLMLYVASALFDPAKTLPVMMDVGTGTAKLLEDPLYVGEKQPRLADKEYYELIEEFMLAVRDKWPECLVQFEDFPNPRCFTLIDEWQPRQLCFNDDIQGTGAVILSGLVNAFRVSGTPLADQKVLFLGAGSAATGVAGMIATYLAETMHVTAEKARQKIFMFDIDGLVCGSRKAKLPKHLLPYAHDGIAYTDKFMEALRQIKPTAIIGLSGAGRLFTEEVVREHAKNSARPIIFALSNPTSKAECTAEDAYRWTDGKCVFAAGSPFDPVTLNGKVYIPGQGNNMFIFPGLGFGAVLAKSKMVTDAMIMRSAKELATCVTDADIAAGKIFPAISEIQDITRRVAAAVMDQAFTDGVSQLKEKPKDLISYVKKHQWSPEYPTLA